MKRTKSKIMALIPAYNEAAHIGPVVAHTTPHLPVLVIDDGSNDDTAKEAATAGASVLRQPSNRGKGAALQTGFRWALAQEYTAVLTLDADGQHDPAEIPAFLSRYAEQPSDLLIGARDFREMPFTRRLANIWGQRALSWALGQPVRDNQSGYRLISQRLMAILVESQEAGFEFEVEMVVRCVLEGYRLNWVSIRTIYAGERSHIRPLQHTRNFLQLVWRTRRRVRHRRSTPSDVHAITK